MMINEKQIKYIQLAGIAIFTFLFIFEFSSLIDYLCGQILFLTIPGTLSILFIPEIIDIIIYTFLIIRYIPKVTVPDLLHVKKYLNLSMSVFFGIIFFRYVYSFYFTGLLFETFPEEFDAFHQLRDDHPTLDNLDVFIPYLKYLILAIYLIYIGKRALSAR